MAKEETTAGILSEASAPVTIRAQYIKDLSFESPNPIKSFTGTSESQPNIGVNVQASANNLGNNNFEVILELHAEAKRDNEVLFVAELSYGCIVTVGNQVLEDQIGPLVMIECPHLLFPFARNILADVTRDGGFPPLYLSPIDFVALYNQSQQSMANEAATTA